MMLLIGLCPILIIGFFVYDHEITYLKNSIDKEILDALRQNSREQSRSIESIKNSLSQVFETNDSLLAINDLYSEDIHEKFAAKLSLGTELEPFTNYIPGFYDFTIVDPIGFDVIYHLGSFRPHELDKTYLEKAKITSVVTDVYLNSNPEFKSINADHPFLFSVAIPIFSDTGLIGIAYVSIDATVLDRSTHSLYEHPDFDSYLINSQGIIVSKPKFDKNMMTLNLFKNRPELELRQTIPNTDSHTKIF